MDWYPWGEEAFEKARKENRLVFLSIGYSTCHWCHVMAHESFEDPEVAGLMNRVFVSIKVDREERPDIDNVYMAICQALLGRGGWPLNIIMTPGKKPFFAGTYIPKKTRQRQIGMLELVPMIEEIWEKKREEVLDSAEKATAAIQEMLAEPAGKGMRETVFQEAYEELLGSFDRNYGGFGRAPKFPAPHKLFFLLRYWRRKGDQEALHMVKQTLDYMQRGGIHDQLGSGFHRYSTDEMWVVPHFEKMLYDQALLASAYSEAYLATGNEQYRETAKGTIEYVLRDLASPEGGFYCGEDADVEGEEGRYYLWTLGEVKSVLSPEEADLIIKMFNLKEEGNFEEEIRGKKTGSNILYLARSQEKLASKLNIPLQDIKNLANLAREKLHEARKKRKRPLKDDKILTDWNGLLIAALAKGFLAFGEEKYLKAAEKAADFLLNAMYSPQKRLLHRYRNGAAGVCGTADDYAFLIHGLLELYEAGFKLRYLQAAVTLNLELIEHFWDPAGGGLFFSATDSEALIFRKKEFADTAIPSGSSIEMLNLQRLSRISADPLLEEFAEKLKLAFSGPVQKIPSGYTQFLSSLDFGAEPSYEVVVAGNRNSRDTKDMLKELRAYFIPNMVVVFKPEADEEPGKEKEPGGGAEALDVITLAPYTEVQVPLQGKATAYICKDHECLRPTTEIREMLKMLGV